MDLCVEETSILLLPVAVLTLPTISRPMHVISCKSTNSLKNSGSDYLSILRTEEEKLLQIRQIEAITTWNIVTSQECVYGSRYIDK